MPITLFDIQFGANIGPWEDTQLVQSLTQLTKLGYNGVEVTINTYENYADRIIILKEITEDVGIQITSYVLKMDFSTISRDTALLDRFQRIADFIHSMGGKYMIVQQGLKGHLDANVEEQLIEFERIITDFSGICSDNGIELIYQPSPDSFIRSSSVMDRVVELIYPLGTRICFDVCDYMVMGVHPIQFMKKYFDAISIVRLNDMKILKGKKSWMLNPPSKCLLGEGRVDIKSIWTYLQAMEYKGWVIAECPQDAPLEKGIDATTQYINKEMEVFLTNIL